MNDIIKIDKSLEDAGLLIKGVSETLVNKAKDQKVGFLGVLFGMIGASSLGNLLKGRGLTRGGEGTIRKGEGTIRAGQDF